MVKTAGTCSLSFGDTKSAAPEGPGGQSHPLPPAPTAQALQPLLLPSHGVPSALCTSSLPPFLSEQHLSLDLGPTLILKTLNYIREKKTFPQVRPIHRSGVPATAPILIRSEAP